MLEKIGKYKIVGKIGQGAMGEVYKAHDPVLNRFVAIKTIAGTLGSDEQFRKRFHREAMSAAQLTNKNIVTVFELAEEKGMVYMVMELLEGTDLKDLIVKKAALRLEEKLSIIEQMCDGLAYAHLKGVVHRDLKPANIHVLANGTVKIMDFGLARLGVSEITRTGTVMGTPNYMSPEQVRGEKVDARSDIFSVGAVMYELLAGHKPFEAETMHSVLFQVLDQEPQPLRKWIPEMPLPVAHVVEKALAKDPKLRYQSAGDLREGLRNARRVMAAGRAASAALGGPAGTEPEAEATLTRSPPVAATFVSTDHRDWGVTGATALNLAPVSEHEVSTPTERPDPTMLEPVAEEPPQSRAPVYAVGALVAAVALGVAGFVWMKGRQGPGVNPAELAREQDAIIREQLVAGQLELAQTEFANKSYVGAVAQAEKTLGLDPGNAAATDIKQRAEAAIREVETTAARARAAFAKGDTGEATQAVQRLLILDPSHAAVTELSGALNRQFQTQANEARTAAQTARADAVRLRATTQEGFAAADKLVAVADAKLAASNFAEATQKYLEANEGFGRARRAAEAVEAAARRAATIPSSVPSAARILPSSVPSAVTSLTPTIAPSASAAPSAFSPPPSPSSPAASPSASATTTAPSAAGAEASIRRALADYARAFETKDIALFKSVFPGLSADQEKGVREGFKNVKSQQVSLTVEAVDVRGPAATVRITRQDTVNGQLQKARQQTVRMTQHGAGWIIEGFGQ
jgi:serine/threonine-protein kinase